jgi:acyl transferase domain-containing protein/aryl carrier-like protein
MSVRTAPAALDAEAIAIIGMACRFPDAPDTTAFWRNLIAGRESVRRFTPDQLTRAGVAPEDLADPDYVPAAVVLEGHDCFDAEFFGVNPREARVMDPQHRKFLECAWSALEDAGHTPASAGRNIGVFAGSGMHWYLLRNVMPHAELVSEMGEFLVRHTANDKDFLATRVSYHLDLHGPSINVQTACSTSLVALHLACQSLLNGECDLALAGGSTIEVPHGVGYAYREGEIRSADGHCRPFDADAGGTVFGSGCGVVVLRRLADALADGDFVRAVVRGTAINNDGSGKAGYLAPSVEGQAHCIAEAIAIAGVDPATIGYVEAHGTGTRIGDPIEVAALTKAFGAEVPRQYCGLGSLKANVGHLDTAAGMAGVIKLALALEHGQLPPSINYKAPNREIDFAATPFRVVDRVSPWPALGAPRRAGISSLGVGGTNAHAVLEQAPRAEQQPKASARAAACTVLTVSARTPAAALAAAARLADRLEDGSVRALDDVGWTLREGRVAFAQRIAVAAADAADAAKRLRTARPVAAAASAAPGVVFLFPGQGTQYPQMARGVHRRDPDFRSALDRCFAVLRDLDRDDVVAAIYPDLDRTGTVANLRDTWITQPALFCIEYAAAQALLAKGLRPAAMLGHSLGEYVAACIAGVFELGAALELVCRRGEMIGALPPGAMVAVALAADRVAPLLGGEVSLAAVNAPELTVCSGPPDAIARLSERLRAEGHTVRALETSHAFHSAMLDPVLERFRAAVRDARPRLVSGLRIVSNLDGNWLDPVRAASPDYWVDHLRSPVRFATGVERLAELGSTVCVEVGPGHTLSTLVASTRPDARRVTTLPPARDAGADIENWYGCAGALWSHGVPVDWAAWGQATRGRRVSLPTYPFEQQRHWLDPPQPRAEQAPADSARRPIERWFHTIDWHSLPPPRSTAAPRRALVFARDDALGHALLRAVADTGAEASLVVAAARFERHDSRFELDPGSDADWQQLVETLSGVTHVLYAWPLTQREQSKRARREAAFDHLLRLAQRLERLADGERGLCLLVASADAQVIAGQTDADPVGALVAGVVRTAARELSGVRARWVDFAASATARPQPLAAQLVAELCAGDDAMLVAWRGSRRLAPSIVDLPLTAPSGAGLPKDGAYLITGAFGGAGRMLARHLAHRGAARLVLVSRRALPPPGSEAAALAADDPVRRALQFVRGLRRSGARIDLVAADVADGESLARALVALGIERLDGVFHTAGVLDDGPLATKTVAAATRVLHPKVDGALGLRALERFEPGFIAYFSSISALAGAAGQIDYTAANAYLDAHAQAADARGSATRHIALAWSMLRDAGMAHELALRAGIAVDLPTDTEAVEHEVLTARRRESDRSTSYHALLAPESCWLLDQHRLRSGPAIMPATGYLDLVAAAWRDHTGADGGYSLADVVLRAPLLLGARQRARLDITFEWSAEGRISVGVSSVAAGSAEPTEHLSATLIVGAAPPPSLPPAGPMQRIEEPYDHPALAFGRAWQCIEGIEANQHEARISLALPGELELDGHPLHAALLDMAVGGAQRELAAGLDRASLLPFRYGELWIAGSLPRLIESRIRARVADDGLHLDVDLADRAGTPLLRVRDLVLRVARLTRNAGAETTTVAARHRNRLLAAGYEEAYTADEFIAALERVLGSNTPPYVAIAPRALEAVLRDSVETDTVETHAQPAAVAHVPRPRLATPYSAPADDAERAIAAAWEAILEIDGIGSDDNFFELGGHSLLLTRLLSRLRREHRIDVPMERAFDAPTIRAWAQAAASSTRTPAPAAAPIRRVDRNLVRVSALDTTR